MHSLRAAAAGFAWLITEVYLKLIANFLQYPEEVPAADELIGAHNNMFLESWRYAARQHCL